MTDTAPGFIAWDDLKAEVAAVRTPEQRREYEDAGPEVEIQILLSELIYTMCGDS